MRQQIRTEDIADGAVTSQKLADVTGPFARLLSSNLTLPDTVCLVITRYIDLANYVLTLEGDARLEIL